jgi:hypothetical protein
MKLLYLKLSEDSSTTAFILYDAITGRLILYKGLLKVALLGHRWYFNVSACVELESQVITVNITEEL